MITASRLSSRFKHLVLDADEYDDKGEFIRILVRMSELDDISDDDVDALTSSIESAVSEFDDRFPSVRFSEP